MEWRIEGWGRIWDANGRGRVGDWSGCLKGGLTHALQDGGRAVEVQACWPGPRRSGPRACAGQRARGRGRPQTRWGTAGATPQRRAGAAGVEGTLLARACLAAGQRSPPWRGGRGATELLESGAKPARSASSSLCSAV